MTEANPLFTVLMANYNNERFIEEAVRSVQVQTYPHWELIIIDDASTDNSWELISRLAQYDLRIRTFRNKKNIKVGATKRKCVDMASAEICGILDADDALTPDALAVMAEAHYQHPECSLISSTHYLCDEALRVESRLDVQEPIKPGKTYLESTPGVVHHFWTFKKRYYDETEGFSVDYVLAEDQDLFYKLEEVGQFHYIDLPLYYYRIHRGGISSQERTAIAFSWHIQAMKEALARRRRSGAKGRYKREVRVVADNINNFLYWGIGKVDSKRMFRHALDLIRMHPAYLAERAVIRNLVRAVTCLLVSSFSSDLSYNGQRR
jgi:glycosyltransferase involved in cell wall biosynthesis